MAKEISEEKEKWFNEVWERLRLVTGAKTQMQMASALNVRQSSISDAKRRQSIPAEWYLKLFRSHGVNPDWLEFGRDPVYLDPDKGKISDKEVLANLPSGEDHQNLAHGTVLKVSSMMGMREVADTWTPDYIGKICVPTIYANGHIMVVQANNDSMRPMIMKGAYVGIDMADRDIQEGGICAINLPHLGLIIRRVQPRENSFVLVAEAQESGENLEISGSEMAARFVGNVRWVIQNFS